MRTQRLLLFLPVVVLALYLFLFPTARSEPAIPKADPRPKLILFLVIDQFRYDYLMRFRPQFVERGFNLLLSGANFLDCRYDYASTATGPGHATLSTGAYPNLHGIIGNEWYDRALHRQVYCVEDRDTRLVDVDRGEAGGAPGASPKNLSVSTLGDELRIGSDFRSKVIALSLKDRAAVLSGGHTANAAYWYDNRTGHFITSTYYMPALPSWVTRFNDQPPAKAYCGRAWQALPETPDVGGKVLKEFKPAGNEACPSERFLAWLDSTPSMNEIELNFAREAIKNERLGQGPDTDLLAVSLSVNDYVGHAFGPYSPEVADVTLRTDRYLADFFSDLDRLVGLKNVWIALSADHGVAPNPRFIKEHHLGMGSAQPAAIRSAIERALNQAYGEDQWIEAITEWYIYLNPTTLKKHQLESASVQTVAAEAAVRVPGVWAAFTGIQLVNGILSRSPLAKKVSNSFDGRRSGDVFLVLEPYAVPVQGEVGSTHGTPWNYDAQVPLILWGEAFRPGNYALPCEPIDLVPTLASALGISQPSGAQGRPLTPTLK